MGKSLANEGAAEYDSRTLSVVVESLVTKGDVSALSPEDKARFYVQMCVGLGLNPASNPLAVLKLNGKEVFYPTRGATDQLAAIHRLNREIVDGPKVIDVAGTKLVYAMCRATHPNGRVETAVATVPLTDPANVLMRAETKAKRRATLSILGLGMLDESELETIPGRLKSEAPPIDLGVLDAKQNEPEAPVSVDPPAPTTPRELLEASLDESKTVTDVAQAWIDQRSRFEKGTPEGQSAWVACLVRAIELLKLKDSKAAREAAKKAILEEIASIEQPDPTPPEHSTGEHRAAPATDAEGAAEAAAIATEGSSARAWIEKTKSGYHDALVHLVRSYLAHRTDFGADHEEAERVFVEAALRDWACGRIALERLVRTEEQARQKSLQSARRGKLQLVRRAA